MNQIFGLVLVDIVIPIITLYIWLLVIQAVMSWLLVFNIINPYNRFVSTVSMVLYRITNPLLRPIRKIIPGYGGIDFSFLILILLLYFFKHLIYLLYVQTMWS